jgi:hypothetical protein
MNKIKIFSLITTIISYSIFILGLMWYIFSLILFCVFDPYTFNSVLIIVPTIVLFLLYNYKNDNWNIFTHFLSIIYFIISLAVLSGLSLLDIRLYIVIIPVLFSLHILKFDVLFNNIKNWENLLKNNYIIWIHTKLKR